MLSKTELTPSPAPESLGQGRASLTGDSRGHSPNPGHSETREVRLDAESCLGYYMRLAPGPRPTPALPAAPSVRSAAAAEEPISTVPPPTRRPSTPRGSDSHRGGGNRLNFDREPRWRAGRERAEAAVPRTPGGGGARRASAENSVTRKSRSELCRHGDVEHTRTTRCTALGRGHPYWGE